MTAKTKLLIDIIERAVFTWLEVFFGLLIASEAFTGSTAGETVGILSTVQTAAVAAIPAALAVLKGALASIIGNRSSAAALPADAD